MASTVPIHATLPQVDALQYLVDNNVFDALEARVTEVLGGLEQRIAALEGAAAQGSEAGKFCGRKHRLWGARPWFVFTNAWLPLIVEFPLPLQVKP